MHARWLFVMPHRAAERACRVLTIFTAPKPFTGHVGSIQRNAISSWRSLGQGVRVLLCGDEAGMAEAAREFEVEQVAPIARTASGTPLLNDIFRAAHERSHTPLLCFVNADIILTSEFLDAARAVMSLASPALLIGETVDVDMPAGLDVGAPQWEDQLASKASRDGTTRGPLAMDYFLFTRGLFVDLPAFAVGRARFDNWLVWRALRQGAMVIDGSSGVFAVHQRHAYEHLPGGKREAYTGRESKQNERIAGLWRYLHLYNRFDAPYEYSAGVVSRRAVRWAWLRQCWYRARGLLEPYGG